jgi:hypothetical protein
MLTTEVKKEVRIKLLTELVMEHQQAGERVTGQIIEAFMGAVLLTKFCLTKLTKSDKN